MGPPAPPPSPSGGASAKSNKGLSLSDFRVLTGEWVPMPTDTDIRSMPGSLESCSPFSLMSPPLGNEFPSSPNISGEPTGNAVGNFRAVFPSEDAGGIVVQSPLSCTSLAGYSRKSEESHAHFESPKGGTEQRLAVSASPKPFAQVEVNMDGMPDNSWVHDPLTGERALSI
eukprot:gnl/TRDRNA2_/TRDRNA2_152756_c2_seq1.p1 gnl/TRDRNA2_/TRDRNA2_152756_c2~~gnl/TRDRNA2_/TRDRNA2_152756_c2_seq1.p1  ORF type:complete len:194 (-),score=20.57 gnl/TRDRNA2_/TRDRNA2_152756_c2_seq1:15-527(-)